MAGLQQEHRGVGAALQHRGSRSGRVAAGVAGLQHRGSNYVKVAAV
jgi:hypothetical protein